MDKACCSLPCSLVVIALAVLACLCLGLIGFTTLIPVRVSPTGPQDLSPTLTRPTPTHVTQGMQPVIPNTPIPLGHSEEVEETGEVTTDTLSILRDTRIPTHDRYELARRLQGKGDLPTIVAPRPEPYKVGDRRAFWVRNVDRYEFFQADAILQYVTAHLYFWIEDGLLYDAGDLRLLAESFESQIYPTTREFFGSEWTPGVDRDPHLYVVYTRGLGGRVAGYYSSSDEYHPLAYPYSNGHEMFVISADRMDLGREVTFGVLAHEFQHMIHWNTDRDESTWLNEGLSELATLVNGYSTVGHESIYSLDPDVQLNDWPDHSESKSAHYGASFLYLAYILGRFGETVTREIVAHPENGLESIDLVLEATGLVDPLSENKLGADEVFADWVLANYLQDSSIDDGRYSYPAYTVPFVDATESFRSCPVSEEERQVHQYGVDYIRFNCRGDYTLHFRGATQTHVLPVNPYSGVYAFWSNKGDESNMTLTREFDFTEATSDLSLSYWTWYDIEEGYDYLYVEASLDGENWEILRTPAGTDRDPFGNSYGWGYTGKSGRGPSWIEEEVDLSRFAGKKVAIRFEYITDAAVNGDGLLLDDVTIQQAGYHEDFERDEGGWSAEGFVRIDVNLPQTYRVSLITMGRTTSIQQISLSAGNTAEVAISIGESVDEVVLVVSGTTRFTRHKADYWFSLQR